MRACTGKQPQAAPAGGLQLLLGAEAGCPGRPLPRGWLHCQSAASHNHSNPVRVWGISNNGVKGHELLVTSGGLERLCDGLENWYGTSTCIYMHTYVSNSTS